MSRPGRRGAAVAAVAAGVVGCVALGGCVSLPTTGSLPRLGQVPSSPGPAQNDVVLTPIPPGSQWQPRQIVSGFLAATGATWTGRPSSLSVARDYLTSAYAKSWHPSPAATVIDSDSSLTPIQISPRVTGGQTLEHVTVTSQHLETLVSANAAEAGSIEVSSLPKPYTFDFKLVLVDDRWRIAGISGPPGMHGDTILLLTKTDFQRDYQPRNLYFPAISTPHTLVPFPVYVPDQGGSSTGVEQLVDGLTRLPPPQSNWLYRSVTTAFPPGTKVSTQVPPNSNEAIVELSGSASAAGPAALAQMKAQLIWTLPNSPYAAGTGIDAVSLQVGHGLPTLLLPSTYTSWVPGAGNSQLYFQTADRAGQPELDSVPAPPNEPSTRGKTAPSYSTQVPSGGLGSGPLTAVAVSPPSRVRPDSTTTFAGCRGTTVYVAPLLLGGDLTTQTLPASCTSLSWDDQGYLWVTARSDVFRITVTDTGLDFAIVTIPAPSLAQDSFTSLRVASDGVRVAMIARDKAGASVIVTSISEPRNSSLVYLGRNQQYVTVGSGLTDPISVSWWDPDHLLVLNKQRTGSELYEVPLNGGQPTRVPTPARTVSVAANGSDIAVSVTRSARLQPEVRVSTDFGGVWDRLPGARDPAYPG
jgi:Lipoprotein LpqB beta-propeller domain